MTAAGKFWAAVGLIVLVAGVAAAFVLIIRLTDNSTAEAEHRQELSDQRAAITTARDRADDERRKYEDACLHGQTPMSIITARTELDECAERQQARADSTTTTEPQDDRTEWWNENCTGDIPDDLVVPCEALSQ